MLMCTWHVRQIARSTPCHLAAGSHLDCGEGQSIWNRVVGGGEGGHTGVF